MAACMLRLILAKLCVRCAGILRTNIVPCTANLLPKRQKRARKKFSALQKAILLSSKARRSTIRKSCAKPVLLILVGGAGVSLEARKYRKLMVLSLFDL